MRKLKLFFIFFIPLFTNAQIQEAFNDGDFSNAPEWIGHNSNFFVNNLYQLQSKAVTTSISWLFTPSNAIDDAVWQCNVKINYSTSASNYAMFYVISDTEDLTDGCNGYYIQVGGTNDEISLYLQQGTKRTKIIDGTDKRTDTNPVDLQLKLTRSRQGNFVLYSKFANESDFKNEGSTTNLLITSTNYVGLLYSNTSTTGNAYIFDDIFVSGNPASDTQSPKLVAAKIISETKIQLDYSEALNIANANFSVHNFVGSPVNKFLTNRNKSIELVFDKSFEKGILYEIIVKGIADLSGNEAVEQGIKIGIPENALSGDLVFNELMFDAPENGSEYVEIQNLSSKVIDLSKIAFCTRKTNGDLNSSITAQTGYLLGPNQVAALTSSPDSVLKFYVLSPHEVNIYATKNWYNLNNESATIVICNLDKDTIYDELTYYSKWHFPLITETKGVSLEKINPAFMSNSPDSWHSAATDVGFGTPGYTNSQYRQNTETISDKAVWCVPEAFSPDNDGNNDICLIMYDTLYEGFVANVSIFNQSGEEIAIIAKSSLLGSHGNLFWDGKTKRGTVAETGIYILYFEMFQPQTGKKNQLKLPLVITAR